MSEVILVTTTFYRSTLELRFRLTQKMIAKAKERDYEVVIVDGSPITQISECLQMLGARVFTQIVPGMGPSRRLAFFLAREISQEKNLTQPVFLWLEPEKEDVVRWVPQTITPIEREADIIIPKRSAESWKTYPVFQMETEQTANDAYFRATGASLDPMFGPVAFNSAAMPYFINADGRNFGVADQYVQHYAPLLARHAGLRVGSVEVDFIYPPEQRREEETMFNEAIRAKRLDQLRTLSEAYKKIAAALR